MTNKPMLSVELRELLVRINNLHATGNDIDIEMKELGALLDRPETPYVPKAGWSFKYVENGVIVIRNGEDWTLIKPGEGPIYEQFLYRFCEEQLNKTAAQHHGDPVHQTRWNRLGEWEEWKTVSQDQYQRSEGRLFERRIVYAEQPAPVAVVMPDNLVSHRNSWLQAMERLVELEPRTLAPDEDDKAFWEHELSAMRDMYADFDRLNGVKP